jgi:molybdopterin molybdotransferase
MGVCEVRTYNVDTNLARSTRRRYRKSYMISEEKAYGKILESVQLLPSRDLPLARALNCFARKDYLATAPLPNFDNSAMDGYAVVASSASRGQRLQVVGEQPAGIDRKLRISAGQAVRVFTGAPIPEGADAVVMQEDVAVEGNEIVINTEIESGEFIRRLGCDLGEGQKILTKGERLGAANLALLAAQGFAEVTVGGEVTAGILSTGDELARPGEKLEDGKIYDSNSVLLQAVLKNCGAVTRSIEHCRDDRRELDAALAKSVQNAVLIISGGVSVGEHDFVKAALQSAGGKIDIWRVAIKPGKPFLFGQIGRCAVFGLPGNPVSGFVTFLKFVRPAILKMMGAADRELALRKVSARLTQDASGDDVRPHYLRGKLENGEFTPIGRQESHAIFGLCRSNAMLRVLPRTQLKQGATVEVEIWD